MNLVASDEEVDAKLAEMKAPYTQEEFDKKLQASGLSFGRPARANTAQL